MKRKSYRIIYVATSIILNIVLTIWGFIPFIIALSCTVSEEMIKGRIKQTTLDRIEGFFIMIFIILLIFSVNFILYKLISKKADLKLQWGIIPFITIVITSILIYAFFTLFFNTPVV